MMMSNFVREFTSSDCDRWQYKTKKEKRFVTKPWMLNANWMVQTVKAKSSEELAIMSHDEQDFTVKFSLNRASLVAQLVKKSACNAGDLGWIPGLGRSPGEGKGYPLQYSGLKNSMDCTVYGVTKSRTRMNDFHFHFSLFPLILWY